MYYQETSYSGAAHPFAKANRLISRKKISLKHLRKFKEIHVIMSSFMDIYLY